MDMLCVCVCNTSKWNFFIFSPMLSNRSQFICVHWLSKHQQVAQIVGGASHIQYILKHKRLSKQFRYVAILFRSLCQMKMYNFISEKLCVMIAKMLFSKTFSYYFSFCFFSVLFFLTRPKFSSSSLLLGFFCVSLLILLFATTLSISKIIQQHLLGYRIEKCFVFFRRKQLLKLY